MAWHFFVHSVFWITLAVFIVNRQLLSLSSKQNEKKKSAYFVFLQNGLSILKIKMSCIFLSKNSWSHWIFSSSALLFHIMSTSSMGLYLQKPCAPWARDASFQVVLHLIMLNVSLTFRVICIWGAFTPCSSCMWSWVRLCSLGTVACQAPLSMGF